MREAKHMFGCRWAATVDAGNAALQARLHDVELTRSYGGATVPTTMQLELATNPFLRLRDAALRQALGMHEEASETDVLAALRAHKDARGGWLAWAVMKVYPVASYLQLA